MYIMGAKERKARCKKPGDCERPLSNGDSLQVCDTKLDCHLFEEAEIYFLKPSPPNLFFSNSGWEQVLGGTSRGQTLFSIPRTERILS